MFLCITDARAQLNYQSFSTKRLYFGITLGYNISDYKVAHSSLFTHDDSILTIHSTRGPGFNLGIISNLKFGQYVDLRFIPALSFAEKNLKFGIIGDSTAERKIESIYLDFPLSIRFKSQPIKDIRIYVLAGMKYSLDLASNAKARKAEDQIKVIAHDISYEYGIGIQFFFPLFIFSPEVKFSHGLINIHAPNEQLYISNMIDKLFSRTILFSLHFEG